MADPNFHGVMYVKGHAQDPNCRRNVENGEAAEPLDFAVKFDTCGLFHSDVSIFSFFLAVLPEDFIWGFTIWKVKDISATQILREIKFGVFRRSKTAIFAFLEALNHE